MNRTKILVLLNFGFYLIQNLIFEFLQYGLLPLLHIDNSFIIVISYKFINFYENLNL